MPTCKSKTEQQKKTNQAQLIETQQRLEAQRHQTPPTPPVQTQSIKNNLAQDKQDTDRIKILLEDRVSPNDYNITYNINIEESFLKY